jgi:hypothetical protein
MSFVYDLADTRYKTSVFYQSGYWIKPQGITMISITAIGAGGGGGGGGAGNQATIRCGGAGGGSGGITRIIIPEMFITDSLVVSIGRGGLGGTAGMTTAGRTGGSTYVDNQVNGNGDIYTFVVVASGGTGGGFGQGVANANGGAGATAANVSQALYSTLGQWFAIGGQQGGGSFPVNGTGITVTYGGIDGLPITSGAGGGAMPAGSTTSFPGGEITGSGFVPTNPRGTASFANGGQSGNNGAFSLTPFYSLGGSGGGSGGGGAGVPSSSGGTGGEGNIGCGGGGGGGGTTNVGGVGGDGGRGGNGLVIIQCW